jgi:hypothetical protein
MIRLVALVPLALALLGACLAAVQDSGKQVTPDQTPQKDAKPDPQAKVGLSVNEPSAFQGYTLFCPLSSTKAFLIDMTGHVVPMWEGAATPASSAYLLPNGNLLRPCVLLDNKGKGGGGPDGGRIQEFTWEGDLVWDYKCTPDRRQHHDAIKLPNGNVLMVVWDKKSVEQAAAAGRKGGGAVQTDSVIEVKPTSKTTGEIVWEWNLWDHLIQDFDKDKANFGDVPAHPELVDINFNIPAKGKGPNDWTHINAVAYNAELDQIMLSVHSFSEVWIIDRGVTSAEAKTHQGGKQGRGGDLLYRWGNPRAYRAGEAKDQTSFAQHNAHWIPKGLPGEGHMMIFNNGSNRPGEKYSTVDEMELPVDAKGGYAHTPGQAFGPAKALWTYEAPTRKDLYSSFISGAQRLANGNTLICSGASGIFIEVTPTKEVVWRYVNPVPGGPPGGGPKAAKGGGGAVFRATRIAPDFAALVGRKLTPGKSVEELLPKEEKRE